MGITHDLSAFTAAIRIDRVPPGVAARARLLVLDLAGNIIRARHDAESTPQSLTSVAATRLGAGRT